MKLNEKYIPSPVDTSDVVLDESLLALTETIAENCHDLWAVGRIKEGWTYGEVKDSEKKITPCLVAYDELPEEEKEYDRVTTMETLKLIVKLGYKITKE
ncbi:MAG: Ryanodine receptor Ryr [Clostridia bacterium]|nr:Ryanodine receptor Ryr [Clostridia bacterium]